MLCEMCGKEVESTTRVRVEGTILRLGPECARFGEVVDPVPPPAHAAPISPSTTRPAPTLRPTGPGRRLAERDLYTDIGELELAPDWAKRVRVAREHLGWTPEVLGKKLNEKKSVILKLESGGLHPPDALVRKIEHLLKIRIRAEPESPSS
jgi:putative transcription factor